MFRKSTAGLFGNRKAVLRKISIAPSSPPCAWGFCVIRKAPVLPTPADHQIDVTSSNGPDTQDRERARAQLQQPGSAPQLLYPTVLIPWIIFSLTQRARPCARSRRGPPSPTSRSAATTTCPLPVASFASFASASALNRTWRGLEHPGPARRRYSTRAIPRGRRGPPFLLSRRSRRRLVRASHERRDVGAVAARFLFFLDAAASARIARRARIVSRAPAGISLLLAVFVVCCTCDRVATSIFFSRASVFRSASLVLG